MEGDFKHFKDWYINKLYPDIDNRRIIHKDHIHHIRHHWTFKKHPKKIDLLFELWLELNELKEKYEPSSKGKKLTKQYCWDIQDGKIK